jgi:hypothetical protein
LRRLILGALAVLATVALFAGVTSLLADVVLSDRARPRAEADIFAARPGSPPPPLPQAAPTTSGAPAASASPPASAPSAAIEPSTTPSAPSAAPSALVDPAPAACAVPCCGGEECAPLAKSCAADRRCRKCASGRACVRGACKDAIDKSGAWLLRLAAVRPKKPASAEDEETLKSMINPTVCVRLAGVPPYVCTAVADAVPRGGAGPSPADATRLAVTTSDLLGKGKGIDIELRDGPRVHAERSAVTHKSLKVTSLCWGVAFELKKPTRAEVIFYLDDP